MLKLTWRQAAAWRVRQQHLDERAPSGSLVAVASRLCGLHAQVLSSAELTAWARVADLDRKTVTRALWEERTLLKTWAMRGTLHLLPSTELPTWVAALQSANRRYLRSALWKKYFGITVKQLDALTDAVGAALQDRVLTREELVREVARITSSRPLAAKLANSSWGTMLKPAAFTGRLCFGPSVGPRVRFANPASWAGVRFPRVDPQEAAAVITRRFLTAFGPATAHDLARWWSGGGLSLARSWLSALGDDAVPVDVEGVQAWMLASDARQARASGLRRVVRLLPAFDQYVVGASFHADRLLPGGMRAKVYRPQGWLSPVLLVNGRMEGTWRYALRGSRIDVTVDPFADVPAWVRRAAGEEAERLAAYFDASLSLSWRV